MTFRVIKTIKGRRYLYEQTSVREGKKVRSICKYLGPVDGGVARTALESVSGEIAKVSAPPTQTNTLAGVSSSDSPSPISDDHRNTPASDPTNVVVTPPRQSLKSHTRPRTSSHSHRDEYTPPLVARFELAKHKLSLRSLEKDHRKTQKTLSQMGIEGASLPAIILRHGRRTTHKRQYRDGSYVVTIPRKSKGHRARFRREYRQALSRAMLDAIALQRPEAYRQLAFEFDRSFRDTQKALSAYMAVANKSNCAKILALKWFGVLNKPREVLPDPQKIGLVDYSKRNTWRDELVTILSEVQQKGYDHVREQQQTEEAIALKEWRTAQTMFSEHTPLSPKWWRAKQRCKRALARHSAQKAFGSKLRTLGQLVTHKGRES